MRYVLKFLAVMLSAAVLIMGVLPTWTGALHKNMAEQAQNAGTEEELESGADGEFALLWDSMGSTVWGFDEIMLLIAIGWALVMQVFRGIKKEITILI